MKSTYYDRSFERYDPDDLHRIRKSGLFIILSVITLLVPIGCWIIKSYMVSEYVFFIAALVAGVLQIAFLAGITGLAVDAKGKTLVTFAVVFVLITLSCMLISLLFEEMHWYVMGSISPTSDLLFDSPEYIIWFTAINGCLAGYGITLGTFIMKSDERFLSGDLMFPGALWLIQGVCQIVMVVIFLLRGFLFSYYLSFLSIIFYISAYLPVFVTFFGGLYLGAQLRGIPYQAEGDAWDRFKNRVQRSGQRPFGKGSLIFSLIGITVSTIFYLFTYRYGWFWWAGIVGIVLGIVSIVIEGGNGYAIAGIIVGFFSWIAGPLLSMYTYGLIP